MSEKDLNALLNRITPSNPGRPLPSNASADDGDSGGSSSADHARFDSGTILLPMEEGDEKVTALSALPALPAGDDLYAAGNLPPSPEQSVEPESLDDGQEVRRLGQREETSEPLTPQLARFALSDDELREEFTVRSPDRHVEVVAEVGGRLLALNIDRHLVRNAHMRQLSESVIATVNAAREQADQRVMTAAHRRGAGAHSSRPGHRPAKSG